MYVQVSYVAKSTPPPHPPLPHLVGLNCSQQFVPVGVYGQAGPVSGHALTLRLNGCKLGLQQQQQQMGAGGWVGRQEQCIKGQGLSAAMRSCSDSMAASFACRGRRGRGFEVFQVFQRGG